MNFILGLGFGSDKSSGTLENMCRRQRHFRDSAFRPNPNAFAQPIPTTQHYVRAVKIRAPDEEA